MRKHFGRLLSLAAVFILAASIRAGHSAKGDAIRPGDVPPAVTKAIAKLAPEARITGARKDVKKSGDESTYRLQLTSGTQNLVAKIDLEEGGRMDGHLSEVLAVADVPTSIIQAARKYLKEYELGEADDPNTSPTIRRARSLGRKDFGVVTYRWDLDFPEREVRISPSGDFVRIRENIKGKDLPKIVRAAIEKQFPNSDVDKVDKLIQNGVVTYRMEVEKASGGSLEISVTEGGEITIL